MNEPYPEAAFQVAWDDQGISLARPGESPAVIPWMELRAVLIETNDGGPFGSDVWWILIGQKQHLSIPQGATGDEGLLGRLQQLPGFSNEMVIEAMKSTENQLFLCWERTEATSA